MDRQEKGGMFRARVLSDKRKVKVFICTSIIFRFSSAFPNKKGDTMADRLWISSLPSSSTSSSVSLYIVLQFPWMPIM